MKNFNKFLEGIRWYVDGRFLPEEEPEDQIGKYNDFIADDKFRQFLIDNNCYDDYINNIQDDKLSFLDTESKLGNEIYMNFFLHHDPDTFISAAFDWRLSPQGTQYWSDLYYLWRNYLSEHRN